MTNPNLYTAGGTIEVGGEALYIKRQADAQLLAYCRSGHFAYVLTARQLGKSSLMVQTADKLAKEGTRCVIVDMTLLGIDFTEAAEWYLGILEIIEDELELMTDVLEWWEDYALLSATQRFVKFFKDVVMIEIESPVVIFLDEIDSTLSLDFTDDFFAAIRALYNARSYVPVLQRLTFVLMGVITPANLIRDPLRTPFNIGKRVELTDFTFEEATPLAKGLGLPLDQALQSLRWLLKWTRGHPYLTQRLCLAVTEAGQVRHSESSIKKTVAQTFFGQMSTQDSNLLFVRDMLLTAPSASAPLRPLADRPLALPPHNISLLCTFRDIRLGRCPVHDEAQSPIKSHLKLSGVVYREGQVLRVRNPIYEKVFDRHWIQEHLPKSWWNTVPPSVKVAAGSIIALFISLLLTLILFNQNKLVMERAENERVARETVEAARATAQAALATAKVAIEGERKALATVEALMAQEREEHLKTKREAKAKEALVELPNNPNRALLLALASVPTDSLTYSLPVSQAVRNTVEETKQIRQLLVGHSDAVMSVAWSADGQQLLTGSRDGSVRIWDSKGHSSALLEPHSAPISSVAWHPTSLDKYPNGEQLLIAKLDGSAQIWSPQGQRLKSLPQNSKGIVSAAWHPKGQQLLTGSHQGAQIWDIASAQLSRTLDEEQGLTTRDHRRLMWEASLGMPLERYDIHTARISSVAWSSDGRYILTGSRDGTARLWSVEGQLQLRHTFDEQSGAVLSVALSPDRAYVLTGNADGKARLWSLQGQLLSTLTGHNGAVRAVAWSPNGEQLLTGSDDKSARIWDKETGKELKALKGHSDSVLSLAWHPDGDQVLTGSEDGSARIWDTTTDDINLFGSESGPVWSVAWSDDGPQALIGSQDESAQLWNADTTEAMTLKEHSDDIWSVAWSPNGQQLLTSSIRDGSIRIWSIDTGKRLNSLGQLTSSAVYSLAWSPDGQKVLTGGWDGEAQIWDVAGGTKKLLQTLSAHSTVISSVAWSPDGLSVLTADWDGKVQIWPLQSRYRLSFQAHSDVILSATFSPDGQYILTGSKDKSARIWDAATGQPIQTLTGHSASILSVAWQPNGQHVLTGSQDGSARIWESTTAQPVSILQDNSSGINSVAWSPDGQHIITGSFDGSARIWQADNTLLVAKLTDLVCTLWGHQEEAIRAEIPHWRGCEIERAAVANNLTRYNVLRGEK